VEFLVASVDVVALSRLDNDVSGIGSTVDSVADSSLKKKKKHRTKDSVTANRFAYISIFLYLSNAGCDY